ncbi:hypothetical protein [Paenibacillus foliorum]|uniref:hypothetical protein n=1 Tax=Paenibacillus foliorum TaxID=2654974 RepID=UPI001FE3C35F|nr:hypothetical protein [Paenibacillus foliorum]
MIFDLFQQSKQLKFWLRMSFFPPLHLATAINEEVIDTKKKIQTVLESKFQDWIDAKAIMKDTAFITTLAFLGIVDSIMLELAYGNNEKRLNGKLNASWTVFWRGISQL